MKFACKFSRRHVYAKVQRLELPRPSIAFTFLSHPTFGEFRLRFPEALNRQFSSSVNTINLRRCYSWKILVLYGRPEGQPLLEDMPEEVVREVLLRLSDHKDIEACREAWPETAGPLTSEQRIWKKLVAFHFSDAQVSSYFERRVLKQIQEEAKLPSEVEKQTVDWKDAFHYLRKHYGLREDYAETLSLCRACRCLYWTDSGHPCVGGGDPCFSVIIRPSDFLNFFTL
ncbi:hypothetical protein GE061_002040 [Apolygus lucorum]|uniref:F-box domain-containing protein n=1 Tax=Apolygus lucorum TaxID=248454 RepID=A0A8S9X402_APOLU|nr:hypothetical protein GE061_002040 [Apolygus lucorum]